MRPATVAAEHVIPVRGTVRSPGWVRIEAGRIAEIGTGRPSGPDVEDWGRAAILPGLVNAHTHLGCAFLRGVADDSGFMEWITGDVAPRVIAAVRDEPRRVETAARAAAVELIEGGVTCAAESFLHPAGRTALERAGMRGVFYREYFGAMSEDLDAYVKTFAAQIEADEAAATERVAAGLAPHAPYTCPDIVLRALAHARATGDRRVTIHLDESPQEHRFFVDGSGPMADVFAAGDRRERYRLGRTPTVAVRDAGLLGPETLAVHAVHVTDEDIDVLAETATTVVHCPTSNAKLAVGIAPIERMLDRGVNVALGTDSPASTGKLDMFEEMRWAVLLARGREGRIGCLNAARALEMATLAGARGMGFADEIGTIEVGKRADLTVVALDRPRHGAALDAVSAVVFSSTPDDVAAVYIDGEPRYRREGS